MPCLQEARCLHRLLSLSGSRLHRTAASPHFTPFARLSVTHESPPKAHTGRHLTFPQGDCTDQRLAVRLSFPSPTHSTTDLPTRLFHRLIPASIPPSLHHLTINSKTCVALSPIQPPVNERM